MKMVIFSALWEPIRDAVALALWAAQGKLGDLAVLWRGAERGRGWASVGWAGGRGSV